MTQKDKQLLLKCLCARLPYKVYVNYDSGKDKQYEGILNDILPSLGEAYVEYCLCDIDNIRPYLRPMSSMTKDEIREFDEFCVIDEYAWRGGSMQGFINQAEIMQNGIDWLNAHHFDYRGLIEKGLALEAPEGMYEI